MARLPNFLVIIRSEKLSGKGQGRGVGVRKKERFVLGKRTFRSQKSKHFVLRIINDPISVFVGQDGTFSALLFDGEYRLTTRDGNGPWVNNHESVTVNLKGHTEVNLEVTPYFMISNEQLSVTGSAMNASFMINRIVPDAKISRVMLLLSKTQFADDVNNLYRQDFSDVVPGSVNLSADISGNTEIVKAKALYARVGVLANGADQAIYSPVVRLK